MKPPSAIITPSKAAFALFLLFFIIQLTELCPILIIIRHVTEERFS